MSTCTRKRVIVTMTLILQCFVIATSMTNLSAIPCIIISIFQSFVNGNHQYASRASPVQDACKTSTGFTDLRPKSVCVSVIVLRKITFVQDAQGLKETAKFFNVAPVIVEGVAHDMMLDMSWKRGCGVLLSWLGSIYQ